MESVSTWKDLTADERRCTQIFYVAQVHCTWGIAGLPGGAAAGGMCAEAIPGCAHPGGDQRRAGVDGDRHTQRGAVGNAHGDHAASRASADGCTYRAAFAGWQSRYCDPSLTHADAANCYRIADALAGGASHAAVLAGWLGHCRCDHCHRSGPVAALRTYNGS